MCKCKLAIRGILWFIPVEIEFSWNRDCAFVYYCSSNECNDNNSINENHTIECQAWIPEWNFLEWDEFLVETKKKEKSTLIGMRNNIWKDPKNPTENARNGSNGWRWLGIHLRLLQFCAVPKPFFGARNSSSTEHTQPPEKKLIKCVTCLCFCAAAPFEYKSKTNFRYAEKTASMDIKTVSILYKNTRSHTPLTHTHTPYNIHIEQQHAM